jgi:murein DD-endopeptidase MepM/ murein hydrolase activator NlpD/predicted TPR repeat methyltransferase
MAGLLTGVVLSPLGAQPAPDGVALWRQGQSEQLAGQWEKAIVTLSTLLKMQPQNANAMAALGFSYFKSGDLEAAEKQYRQVLSINNRHVGAGYGLGQVMMSRKKWKEAVGLFSDLLRIAPDAEPIRARHNLALSLHSLERYEEASRIYGQALEQPVDGHYADLYLHAINNEIERRDYARAVLWGEQGTQRFAQNAWLWDRFAWALRRNREGERSRDAYQRAEALAYPDLEPRHKTVLSLPFRGRWRVTQGNSSGPTHRGLSARFAWDFSAVNEQGETRVGDSRTNRDFLSFGQDVLAPADGKVVALENSEPDNTPFHRDDSPHSGNYVIIEHAPGELSSLGHLQQGSIAVKVGEMVQRGQRIARVGNSGYTSLPHLHFSFIGLYKGDRISFPAQFSKYFLWRNGERILVEQGKPEENSVLENNPTNEREIVELR